MVLVPVEIEGKNVNLYMDGGLYKHLTEKVKPSVKKRDFDYVIIVDGEERSGKSVFAMQLAKILDPSFTLTDMCFNPNEFVKRIMQAKSFKVIVFDEAFTGLSSRTSLSEINQLLVSLMMEMGQKNLFIIIVMPSFFMLDRYAVLHRAKGLFHIYMSRGKRGFWKYYNRKKMKDLYFLGKKFYEYHKIRHRSFGKFPNDYMVNEENYREAKRKALKDKSRATRAQAYKAQRDVLLYILYKDLQKTQINIAKLCAKWGFKIARNTISEIVAEKDKELLSGE